MTLQWFLSGTVRQALAMCKHVQKILEHQRDILSAKAIEEVEAAIREVNGSIAAKADKATLQKAMENLEKSANQSLRPYPNAAWRENVEVLLVALAVAMGIRTFFLQPFKIPTGSMQPTLFGVNSQNLIKEPDIQIPTGLERVKQWFQGISYVHVVAKNDGELRPTEPLREINNRQELQVIEPPVRFLIFNIKQTIRIGGVAYTIWFPPDYGGQTLQERAGLHAGQTFHKGEDILNIRVAAGDHLFVDRMTYNFVPPSRGQIVVFETKGIEGLPQEEFYIKRLVALSGEKVQIGNDRHLIIDGKRLDASTPHFENIYGFDPKQPPHESRFSGHVNQKTGNNPQHFTDESIAYSVRDGYLMVMGDNTMNSLDSRYWGDFPAGNVIGRAFSVYWPITDRFGWSCIEH